MFSCTVYLFCFVGCVHTMPFKINEATEEKLTNKINTLLNMESQKDFSSNRERNNRESVIQTKPQLPSNFIENNAANVNSNQKNQDIMEPNSLESHYSEVVQKIFQNAKSPLVRDKENQAAPQTSDDQLSIGTFNRGESLAMLGTEKSIDEVRTEKIESLDETAKPPNLPSNLKKNITQSSCIVTSKSLERNLSHKQSAGSKFLASVSPEEFLKRLKKHLEISKSNLRILKKNFHDFLKEKEKLFRLNQKVSQEHPRAKEIKVSVIRADENDQGASFVQDTRTSAMTPAINPQPISQICPKDCPVNMIHIEHHHHGNSPVPCICENDNLYDANKREDSSISGGKREFLWKSNPNIAAFKSDQKMEEGSERTDEQSDHAKLTMEDVKCTTALTCCPTTCAETCPTTCCTEPPSDGRSCPSCPSLGSHQDSKAQMQPSCLCLAEKAQQELSAQNFDHS